MTNQFSFSSPTTLIPHQVQNFLQLFQGLSVYILTSSIDSVAHDEAPFIEFYTESLATPVVYESQAIEYGLGLGPRFNRTNPVIPLSKFNHQSVQLFLPEITKSLYVTEEKLGHIRNLIYSWRQVANYYIIFAPKFMKSEASAVESFKTFKEISALASFLFVWDLEQIDILCVFCPYVEDAQLFHAIENLSSINRIIEINRGIHRNMLQTTVQMIGMNGIDGICSRSTNSNLFHPVACAVYEIVAQANATVNFTRSPKFPTEWGDNYVSHICGAVYPGLALMLTNRQRKVLFEWGLIGGWTLKFSFVNVVRTHSIGMSAIWSAFSIQMWLFVLGAALSMAALVALAYDRIYSSFADNFKYSLTLVFALAIERFAVSGSRMRNSTMLVVTSIFAWAQLSTVLNTSYKGYLFSTLASVSSPDVPKNMEALATTSAFVFTVTSIGSVDGKKSFFHYQINEVLAIRNRTNDPFGDILEGMSHRLLYSTLEVREAIIIQEKSQSNATTINRWDNSTENLKIPKNHIFVGKVFEVIAYTFTLAMVSEPEDHRGFIFGEDLNLFLVNVPFFIQPNFFLPVFMHGMFGLVQSGIWDMWQRAYISASLFLETKQVVDSVERAGVKVKSANEMFLQLSNEDFRPPKPANLEQPLTSEFVGGPLQALGLGLVLGLIVFMFECIKWIATAQSASSTQKRSGSSCNALNAGNKMEEAAEAEEAVKR